MSHRTSKHLRAPRPLAGDTPHAEMKADGRWIVRMVPGARALKVYRCPSCQATVPIGMAHVVAWPDTPVVPTDRAVDERRHWHTACWERQP